MRIEKLSDIKKGLKSLNTEAISEICLRMAKFKKENKELLSYLLFEADDPLNYVEELKADLLINFQTLNRSPYISTKELRKIVRQISKNSKYTGSKEAEIELLLWFCERFLEYADTHTSHKPLLSIFNRQLEKIKRTLHKLHEDLQFDYSVAYNSLLEAADNKLRYFNKKEFLFEP